MNTCSEMIWILINSKRAIEMSMPMIGIRSPEQSTYQSMTEKPKDWSAIVSRFGALDLVRTSRYHPKYNLECCGRPICTHQHN